MVILVTTQELYEKQLQKIKSKHYDNVKSAIDDLLPLLEQFTDDPKAAGVTLVHDLGDIWKPETIRKFLPDRCKDVEAQEHGKKGGQPKHKKKEQEEPAKKTNYEKQIEEAAQIAVTTNGSQQQVVSTPPAKKENPVDVMVQQKKYIAELEQQLNEAKTKSTEKVDYKKLAAEIITGDKPNKSFEATILTENTELKQEIVRLSEPFEVSTDLSVRDQVLPVKILVTPSKKVCRIELDTSRIKRK